MTVTVDAIRRLADEIRATNAVVVVGAGLSRTAGMPLSNDLPPLIWMALDEDQVARKQVGARIGRADATDATGKNLVGRDDAALSVAYDALRSNKRARTVFQHAFAERDAAVRSDSPTHDALAQLFHTGLAEVVISYNWDTLFERSYGRRYGRLLSSDELFWKPHGDAADPDEPWILPGEPGHVPDALIEKVNLLARERPRLLLLIGYSERDKEVVSLLTGPLADRWSVAKVGPSSDGDRSLSIGAEKVLPALSQQLVPEPEAAGCESIGLPEGERGLGRALYGKGLGPADAFTCPRIPETEVVTRHLLQAYTASISARSGSGKSLCAYQVAFELAQRGFEPVRLVDPTVASPKSSFAGHRFPLLAIVDDAHLAPAPLLKELEELSGPRFLVLTVSTSEAEAPMDRGSIRIDGKRAVQFIADALRQDPGGTLEAVQKVDDRVGEGWLDEPLERRISEAERTAELPWQFCFVLGGGWRRTEEIADAARAEDADLTLAAVAVNQLISGDAVAAPDTVARLANAGGVEAEQFKANVDWLVSERHILSGTDLRCPHQRVATVLLDGIFDGLAPGRKESFYEICRFALGDPTRPMIGVYNLLLELRIARRILVGAKTFGDSLINDLVLRCFAARDPSARMYSAFVLSELGRYAAGWPREVLRNHLDTLGQWFASPRNPMGFGLARLINNIWNRDKDFAREISAHVDWAELARTASCVEPSEAGSVGDLLDRLRLATSEKSRKAFVGSLNRNLLIEKAGQWSRPDLYTLAKLVRGVGGFDEDLGLSMVENAESVVRRRFEEAPVEAFHEFKDVLFDFLRVWDPLQVFRGRLRPGRRARAIARRLSADVDARHLAATISASPRRDLDDCAKLLGYLRRILPRLHRAAIQGLNFPRLDQTINDGWRDPPEDVVHLIGQAATGPDHEPARSWIERNASQLEKMATVLATIAPNVAVQLLRRGGEVKLSDSMCFRWLLVALVIKNVGETEPNLLGSLLNPHVEEISTALERNQNNTYEHVDVVFGVLEEYAPGVLADVLARVDPQRAEVAWRACLRGNTAARRAGAKLVEESLKQDGDIKAVGRRLRAQFPKSSVPAGKTTK